jgi:hypothetical protein
MKYVLTWNERSQGSPIEYENAQKRILEVFTQWKAPDNFKIEMFVIRVGDWGGYMLLDCDEPLAVHKFCSMLPAFVFEARPVVPVMDAVRVELEAIAFRDGLKGKWRRSRHIASPSESSRQTADGRDKPGHPAFAAGKSPYSAASCRSVAASTFAAQNLNSGILPKGSSAGLVRMLAAAST